MTTSQNSAQVIAKAWLDEEFKSSLEKAPAAALKQHGIEPDVVGPVPPRPDELNDELLEANLGDEVSKIGTMFFSHCARGAIFCFSDEAMDVKNKALKCKM